MHYLCWLLLSVAVVVFLYSLMELCVFSLIRDTIVACVCDHSCISVISDAPLPNANGSTKGDSGSPSTLEYAFFSSGTFHLIINMT